MELDDGCIEVLVSGGHSLVLGLPELLGLVFFRLNSLGVNMGVKYLFGLKSGFTLNNISGYRYVGTSAFIPLGSFFFLAPRLIHWVTMSPVSRYPYLIFL